LDTNSDQNLVRQVKIYPLKRKNAHIILILATLNPILAMARIRSKKRPEIGEIEGMSNHCFLMQMDVSYTTYLPNMSKTFKLVNP